MAGPPRPALLLLGVDQPARVQQVEAWLAPRWRVLCPDPDLPPESLRALADRTGTVLHLDSRTAAALGGTRATELYAPAHLACDGSPTPAVFLAALTAEADLATRAALVVTPTPATRDIMRLLHGTPDARLRFVPDRLLPDMLAMAMASALPPPAKPARPLLLAFNHYPVEDAPAGGAVRVRDALRAFAQPTVLVTVTTQGGTAWLGDGLVQIAVPKSLAQHQDETEQRILTGLALPDILTAAHAMQNEALTGLAAHLATRAGCALFSHCYLAPLMEAVRSVSPHMKLIYDSHNVEAALQASLLAAHPAASRLVAYVAAIEQRLVAEADTVFCCAPADADAFTRKARRIVLLPHAMAPQPAPATHDRPGSALRVGFIGSDHPPNRAAARMIVMEFAPRHPQVTFELIGSVCHTLDAEPPANVVLHGVVPEARKHHLLAGWSLALNPVTEGGGASVKLADCLAHGVPILSTAFGARGYSLTDSKAGEIVDLAAFPDALARLLTEPETLRQMARHARTLGAGRDWPALAAPARAVIAALLDSHRPAPAPPPPVPAPPPAPAVLLPWLATRPTQDLPLVLGGTDIGHGVQGARLCLALPGAAPPVRFETGPAFAVTVYEIGTGRILLPRRQITPFGPVTLPMPRSPTGLLVEAEAADARDILTLDTSALDTSALDISAVHISALHGGRFGGTDSPFEQTALADALSHCGTAHARAMAVRSLPPLHDPVLIVANPASPLVRSRARMLSARWSRDMLVADLDHACLVPQRGSIQRVALGAPALLAGLGHRCQAVLLPGPAPETPFRERTRQETAENDARQHRSMLTGLARILGITTIDADHDPDWLIRPAASPVGETGCSPCRAFPSDPTP